MTFADFVAEHGGATEVARKTSGAVSRAHVTNIAARRKRLTPDVAARLEAAFPDVAPDVWYSWTKVPTEAAPIGQSNGAVDPTQLQPSADESAEASA